MPRVWRFAFSSLVALLFSPAAVASLARANTTIGFDDLPSGTSVTNQYLLNDEVAFSGSLDPPVLRQTAAGVAQSPPNVADIHTVCDVDRPVGGDMTATFTSPHAQVSVYVGDQSGNSYPGNDVSLTGYDSSHASIASATTGMLRGGVHNLLSISDPGGRIQSVDVSQAPAQSGACKAAVDDFSFGDTPGPPPPADFALSVRCPPACGAAVSVENGGSLAVPLEVTRNAQSSGAIFVSAQGLPPGVGFNVNPNPDVAGGTSQVTLTLSADANAPPATNVPVTIIGTPTSAAGTAARTAVIDLTVAPAYDLRVQGIDVNQGVQLSNSMSSNVQFNPMSQLGDLPGQSGAGQPSYSYVGLPLVSQRRTIVTVYGTVSNLPGASVLNGVTASLTVTRNGATLGTLDPESANSTVPVAGDGVFFATRVAGTGAFVFALPPSWATATLSLIAQLSPPPPAIGGGGISDCCKADETMTLTGVAFTPVDNPSLDIVGIDSWDPPCTDSRPPSDDQATFAHAIDITPVNLSILSGFGTIDGCPGSIMENDPLDAPVFFGLTGRQLGLTQSQAYAFVRAFVESDLQDQLEEMTEDIPHFPESFFVGVTSYDPGTTRSPSNGRTRTDGSTAIENWTRPLTSVAHETGHLLFRSHASACNGGAQGGTAEGWIPDQMGLIQAVGVDRLDGDTVIASGGGAAGQVCASNNPGAGGCTGGSSAIYDYMSYCAPPNGTYPNIEPNTWISAKGWQEIVSGWSTGAPGSAPDPGGGPASGGGGPIASPASAKPMLAVNAVVEGGYAVLVGIRRSSQRLVPTAMAATLGYKLVARDRRGRVLAQTAMTPTAEHGDPGPGRPAVAFLSLSASLPASSAVASIELQQGRRVLDRVRKPAQPLRVRLLSPRQGQLGRRGAVTIRWRPAVSLRRQLNPRQRLTVSIDYSSDRGRHYHTVYIGPSTGNVTLPSGLFAASRNARIRIRLSDGFDEVAATSGRLRSNGALPRAHILDAPRLAQLASDASISLRGTAQDDQGRVLPGLAMRWYLGARLLGSGQELDAIQLPPGRDRVTLEARDGLGRVGRTEMQLDVVAVAPAIVALRAPQRIGGTARKLTVSISTRADTILSIGWQRWRLGPVIRRIVVDVAPGDGPVQLPLRLTTPGSKKAITMVLQVARG
jgi:hypothetical protein